jgi:transposase InsO family protein
MQWNWTYRPLRSRSARSKSTCSLSLWIPITLRYLSTMFWRSPLEELRVAVRSFGRLYNREWLLERHGYRTPIEPREHLLAQAVA